MILCDMVFYGGLFLYAVDFFGASNYIIFAWILLMIILNQKSAFYISSEGWLLILFSSVYTLTYFCWYPIEAQAIVRFLIAPPFTYIICDTYCRNKGNADKGVKILIWGMFLHGFLNMSYTLSTGYQQGAVNDIWGNSLTTTLQGMLLTPIAGAMCYGIIRLFKRKAIGLVYIVACVISVIFSIITGRRTLVIIFIGILIINILVILYKKHSVETFIKVTLISISVILICVILYYFNIFGIKTFILQSKLYERLFLSDKSELGVSRSTIFLYVLNHLGDYILGGNAPIGIAKYAHNLWLDVMVMCGIIPMILLIIYTCKTARTALSLKNNSDLKLLYCSVFFALNAAFFVEPVLSGSPHVFIIMCMMNGLIYGESKKMSIKGKLK